MEFYSAYSGGRPVRLSEETRKFAYESLEGKYGDEAMKTLYTSMDDVQGFERMTDIEKYDAMILKIAKEAPLRYCEGEKISGAATLGAAIYHVIPAAYKGQYILPSISHLTLDFTYVLTRGINDKQREIEERLKRGDTDEYQNAMLRSMMNVIHALHLWHGRYMEYLTEIGADTAELLARVPFERPRSFKEAVQSIWFMFAFERLLGNWPGIGRIDVMLGEFLDRDLESGAITLDEAREVLAHFFIKGCEWIRRDAPPGSGDAQHYQNLVLGGLDQNEVNVANPVTYLVLDIVEELPIGDFPITVRLNRHTPKELKRKMANVIRHGGGVVAVYNEDIVLKAFERLGYERRDALSFANDGCWEVQIPGKTYFEYVPFDGLGILLRSTLGLNPGDDGARDAGGYPAYSTYEELYEAYKNNLRAHVAAIKENCCTNARGKYDENGKWTWHRRFPCSAISLLEEGCIENARSYIESGAVYSVISPHIGGAADAANSLYAIKTLVFDECKISLHELLKAVDNDWENAEQLRVYIKNKLTYYGNDADSGADEIMAGLLNDFSGIVSEFNGDTPVIFTSGVSTFGRQIEWRASRGAAPFGAKRGDILAPNTSPTPGTDVSGATAVIRSYCKADLSLQGTGAALDIRLYPGAVEGENGITALTALMDGFCRLGGFFMQIDITDAAVLRAAQEDPESYRSLSVRVSGWNARFITLDKEWQQMIIEKTEHSI